MDCFSNKSFLIVGLGISGESCFLSLRGLAKKLLCFDDNLSLIKDFALQYGKEYILTLEILFHGIKYEKFFNWKKLFYDVNDKNSYFLKKNIFSIIEKFDYVVASPGIPFTHPLIKIAKQCNNLIGDVDLLYLKYPDAFYIGVTGSNGKTTTVSLMAELFEDVGIDFALGGNVKIPVMSLPKVKFYILELSSWQIDLIKFLSLDIAVLLNVTEDHLERYGNFENYIKSKAKIIQITKRNSFVFFGVIDFDVSKIIDQYKKDRLDLKFFYLLEKDVISYGEKFFPVLRKDKTIFSDNGNNSYEYHKIFVRLDSLYHVFQLENFIYDLSSFPTLGELNKLNLALVYKVAFFLGIRREKILDVIKSFNGVIHRMQYVRQKANVIFINDSKATNVASAFNSLKSVNNIYWLAGGTYYSQEKFFLLKRYMKNVKKAYFFGESAYIMAYSLVNSEKRKTLDKQIKFLDKNIISIVNNNSEVNLDYLINFNIFSNLHLAFKEATNDAYLSGEKSYILLSPACKSFDQFRNFEHRGEEFIKLCFSE